MPCYSILPCNQWESNPNERPGRPSNKVLSIDVLLCLYIYAICWRNISTHLSQFVPIVFDSFMKVLSCHSMHSKYSLKTRLKSVQWEYRSNPETHSTTNHKWWLWLTCLTASVNPSHTLELFTISPMCTLECFAIDLVWNWCLGWPFFSSLVYQSIPWHRKVFFNLFHYTCATAMQAFFGQNHQNSSSKKLKIFKTQGKICFKTQRFGTFI